MSNSYELVKEFHQTFGHPVESAPLTPDVKVMKFRTRFIMEETIELIQALGAGRSGNQHLNHAVELMEKARDQMLAANDYEFNNVDLVEVADALGDLDYITNGAALVFGIPLPEVTAEIHRSNMTKLGADGQPIRNEEGKVQKGPNYEPPQLEMILFPAQSVDDEEVEEGSV